MDTGSVFLVWHSIDHDDDDLTNLLGVYSTREKAESRVARSLTVAGFVDFPGGFLIDEYQIDEDQWTEGFELVAPEGWTASNGDLKRLSRPFGQVHAAGPDNSSA